MYYDLKLFLSPWWSRLLWRDGTDLCPLWHRNPIRSSCFWSLTCRIWLTLALNASHARAHLDATSSGWWLTWNLVRNSTVLQLMKIRSSKASINSDTFWLYATSNPICLRRNWWLRIAINRTMLRMYTELNLILTLSYSHWWIELARWGTCRLASRLFALFTCVMEALSSNWYLLDLIDGCTSEVLILTSVWVRDHKSLEGVRIYSLVRKAVITSEA